MEAESGRPRTCSPHEWPRLPSIGCCAERLQHDESCVPGPRCSPRNRVLSRPGSGDYRGSLRPRSRNEHRTPETKHIMLKPLRRFVPPLLRENVVFRRFWLAQTISLFGDQISLIASWAAIFSAASAAGAADSVSGAALL